MTRGENTEPMDDGDNKLVMAYRNGDLSAIDTLTDRMTSTTYRFLFGKTRSQHIANELLPIVFLKLDKALFRLTEPIEIKLDAFCRTIAFRVLMSHFRSLFNKAQIKAESIVAGINEPPGKNVERLWYDELEFLQAAIAQLAERDREIIEMGFWENMSVKEMAEDLDLSETRIRQLIARALKRLRRELTTRNKTQSIDPRV